MPNQLLSIEKLSAENGIPVRTLRTLYKARRIPFIKAGHRTLLFNPDKVRAALEKLEVGSVEVSRRK